MTMRTEFSECVNLPLGPSGSLIPLAGVAATVFASNTSGADIGGALPVFKDRISNIPGNNITDSAGNVSFYLSQGDYNIHLADTHIPVRFSSYVRAFTSVTSGIAADYASLLSTIQGMQSRAWEEHLMSVTGTNTTTSASYAFIGDGVPRIHVQGPTALGISYEAIWAESVAGASRAAIFINGPTGSFQLMIDGNGNLQTQAASRGTTVAVNNWGKLVTCKFGLVSSQAPAYVDDVVTGPQATAIVFGNTTNGALSYELGGSVMASTVQPIEAGGMCWVFVDPGSYFSFDYEVDVMYKISSGTLSVKERTMRVLKAPL